MQKIISHYNSLQLPTKKDEHWRFSNRAFWSGEVENLLKVAPVAIKENSEIFENQVAQKFLQTLLKGSKLDAYCALNFADAKLFNIAKNAEAKISSKEFANVNIFEIEEGANVEICDETNFEADKLGTLANFYFVKSGAKLNVNTFYCQNSPRYTRADFYLQDGAVVVDAFVEAGKANTRAERNFELAGKNSKAEVAALFVATENFTHDLRTSQHHTCPEAFSNLKVKNILSDTSRTAFAGLIRVEEEAQKTESYQSCRSLLVSDKARASGIPVLEILANDVMCSHGCAVAQPDKDEMFYMKSRGLDSNSAQKLLLNGFANEVIEKFSNDEFAAKVLEKIS